VLPASGRGVEQPQVEPLLGGVRELDDGKPTVRNPCYRQPRRADG
jgi:hypothetical protein